jgi:putative transposase
VHWHRNIFSHVPSTKVREIAAMLKAIHASEDVVAAREKAIRVIEKVLGFRLTKAAELAEAGVEETLTYYAFPEEHWRRIRTNNPPERLLREITTSSATSSCASQPHPKHAFPLADR